MRAVPGIFALAVDAFVYRLWMIKGIRGYQTNGRADIIMFSIMFSALQTAKGLLWPLWALAFFRLNWSARPGITLVPSMAAFLVILALSMASMRVDKMRLSAVPIVVLSFNLACLEANIAIWTQVAEAARAACQTLGLQITHLQGTVEETGLPSRYRGVFFLTNNFAECVQINSGVPASRIVTTIDKTLPAHTFRWNEGKSRFEEVKQILP